MPMGDCELRYLPLTGSKLDQMTSFHESGQPYGIDVATSISGAEIGRVGPMISLM